MLFLFVQKLGILNLNVVNAVFHIKQKIMVSNVVIV